MARKRIVSKEAKTKSTNRVVSVEEVFTDESLAYLEQ